jgi:hypothetical protein
MGKPTHDDEDLILTTKRKLVPSVQRKAPSIDKPTMIILEVAQESGFSMSYALMIQVLMLEIRPQ